MTNGSSSTTHHQHAVARAFWFNDTSSVAHVNPVMWDQAGMSPRTIVPPLIELFQAYLTVQMTDAVGLQVTSVDSASLVPPASEPGTTAKAIRKAHEDSGLTWEQLARTFSVSRRSLHLWANGGRMNAANVEMLMSFVNLVNHMNAATPPERRAALLAIKEDGRSVLESFRSHYLERRGFAESEQPPGAFLGALHDDVST